MYRVTMSIFPRKLYDKFVCCFSFYVRLPKAEHYISGLKFAHLFVVKNFDDILIDYLKEFSNIKLPAAAKIVNVQEGFSSILVIFTVHLSDAYLGLFKTIIFANVSYLIGLVLFFTAAYVDGIDKKILFVALFFLALGISGRDFLLETFLSDQRVIRPDDPIIEEDEENRVSWRPYVMLLLCAAVSFIFQFIPNYKLVIIITIVAMFVGLLCFSSSHSFYRKRRANGGPLGTTSHVFRAATLSKPSQSRKNERDSYNVLLPSIPFFGWLDGAAIPESSSNSKEELETDNSTVAQVELSSISKEELKTNSTVIQVELSSISKEEIETNCTVTQVKEVKRLLTMIPMWTTFLVYSLVEAAGSTFFLEQSSSIKDDFPLVIFVICEELASLIASDMGKIFRKLPFLKTRLRLVTLAQIGLGMLCSLSCGVVAWRVEKFRLNNKNMNVLWLTPQFLLIGCMKGFAEEGLSEFFKKQVSGSMRDYGPPFSDFILGIGKFISAVLIVIFKDWFGEDVKTSHLYRYYELLAFLSVLNFFLFVSIAVWYGNQQAQDENLIPVKVISPQQQAEKKNSSPVPIILPQVQQIHSFPPRGSHVPSQEKERSPILKLRRVFTAIINEKKA